MFTGIVEELGIVNRIGEHRLTVGCRTVTSDAGIGSSIAVNGVCLTAVARSDAELSFDLSDETLERSSLRRLARGDRINLERPVSLAARLGGHLVQGHVDGVGIVDSLEPDGIGGAVVRIRVPQDLVRSMVDKGSVAIDGVSLTIASLLDDGITIALIPHTCAVTTFGSTRVGDPVNVETDVIAKYVERLMERAG
jgi:riboflavin synthase